MRYRFDDYILDTERFSRAIALSPNDPQRWAFYTYGELALIFKGDYEQALDWTEKLNKRCRR